MKSLCWKTSCATGNGQRRVTTVSRRIGLSLGEDEREMLASHAVLFIFWVRGRPATWKAATWKVLSTSSRDPVGGKVGLASSSRYHAILPHRILCLSLQSFSLRAGAMLRSSRGTARGAVMLPRLPPSGGRGTARCRNPGRSRTPERWEYGCTVSRTPRSRFVEDLLAGEPGCMGRKHHMSRDMSLAKMAFT